jgi:hypothetical protein
LIRPSYCLPTFCKGILWISDSRLQSHQQEFLRWLHVLRNSQAVVPCFAQSKRMLVEDIVVKLLLDAIICRSIFHL